MNGTNTSGLTLAKMRETLTEFPGLRPKNLTYAQMRRRTDAFWERIHAQFCPGLKKGDVLLLPGHLYRSAVGTLKLDPSQTPDWIATADGLEGMMVYFVQANNAAILALDTQQFFGGMQASNHMRFIDTTFDE